FTILMVGETTIGLKTWSCGCVPTQLVCVFMRSRIVLPALADRLIPAKSARQLRAMYAAAQGHSTLGIPQSVGREFVRATPKKKRSSLVEQMRSHLTPKGKLRRAS